MEKWEACAGFTVLGLKPLWVHQAGGNQPNPANHLPSSPRQGVDSRVSGALEGGRTELALSLGGNPPCRGPRTDSVGERRSLLSGRVERKR